MGYYVLSGVKSSAVAVESERTTTIPQFKPGLILAVFCGGMVGTSLRALIEFLLPTATGAWPWATFIINMVGSFVLGGLYAVLARLPLSPVWTARLRFGVGTGVVGGFTTYSTFIVEADKLLASHALIGLGYMALSVTLGVTLALLGAFVGSRMSLRWFGRRPSADGGAA